MLLSFLSWKVIFDIQLTYIVHYALFAAELFSDVQPLVQSALDGYNVSIFAYGQTHSGKTHTMVSLHIFCCACVPMCILCPMVDIINFFLHLIMFGLINCLFDVHSLFSGRIKLWSRFICSVFWGVVWFSQLGYNLHFSIQILCYSLWALQWTGLFQFSATMYTLFVMSLLCIQVFISSGTIKFFMQAPFMCFQTRDLLLESGKNMPTLSFGADESFVELVQEKVNNPLEFTTVLKTAFRNRGNDLLKINVSHLYGLHSLPTSCVTMVILYHGFIYYVLSWMLNLYWWHTFTRFW